MQKLNRFELGLIRSQEERVRQTGRTTALIQAAKSVPNSVYITLNLDQANRIAKEHNIKTCSVKQLESVLMGSDLVPFFDHLVVAVLAANAEVHFRDKVEAESELTNIKQTLMALSK